MRNTDSLSLPHEKKALTSYGHAATMERASVARVRREVPPERVETTVDGLRCPPNLQSTNAVTFVITQQVGKLKPKDLKTAIERQREVRAQQRAEQESLRALTGMDASAGALSVYSIRAEEGAQLRTQGDGGEAASRQLKELAFLQVTTNLVTTRA